MNPPARTREEEQTMTKSHAPKPLTGPLRNRLNRLAHAQALQFETRLRASLLAQILTARDSGKSFDQLAATVNQWEAAPV
jgi:hypothetical protein